MIINLIIKIFKKYIYTPHEHTWVFDRQIQTYSCVGILTAEGTKSIYICSGCKKIQQVG